MSVFTLGVIIINLVIWMLYPVQLLYIIHNQKYMHWLVKHSKKTFNAQYYSVATTGQVHPRSTRNQIPL